MACSTDRMAVALTSADAVDSGVSVPQWSVSPPDTIALEHGLGDGIPSRCLSSRSDLQALSNLSPPEPSGQLCPSWHWLSGRHPVAGSKFCGRRPGP